MMEENDFFKKTVQIKRTFNAKVEVVWEAWTNPDHIKHWWNPQGSETTIEKHDFIVGGEWKYSMMMQNGHLFIAEGIYTEIEFLKKISSTADFKPMTEGVIIQSLFEAKDDKTEFTFNVIHPTEDYRMQQEKMGIQNGWGSVFTRLDEFLKTKV